MEELERKRQAADELRFTREGTTVAFSFEDGREFTGVITDKQVLKGGHHDPSVQDQLEFEVKCDDSLEYVYVEQVGTRAVDEPGEFNGYIVDGNNSVTLVSCSEIATG